MGGRKPNIIRNDDGSGDVRVTIPAAIMRLVDAYAEYTKLPWEASLRILLLQLNARIDEGDTSTFGVDVQHMMKANRAAQERTKPLGPPIDLQLLHRSDKAKSGFVGVYANGKGFRAMAKTHEKGLHYIGTYQAADEAAYQRYLYYRQHELPYGELEIEMHNWRHPPDPSAMAFKGTDEELIAAIREYAELTGTAHIIFGPNDCNVPEKFKQKHHAPRPQAVEHDPPASRLPVAKPDLSFDKLDGFDDDNLPDDVRAMLAENDE